MSKPSSIYHSVSSLTEKFMSDFAADPTEEFLGIDFSEMEHFLINTPVVTYVYNHKTMGYDYFSSSIKEVMGYSNEDFLKGGLEFAMSLVDPKHSAIYNKYIIPSMFKYYALYVLKRRIMDLKFTYTFKIRKQNGEYMWALHHMNVLKTNKWEMPLLTKVFVSDISSVKQEETVDYSVYEKDAAGVYKPIYSKTYHIMQDSVSFTKRELDILSLLGQGKTSGQIADELHISIHTVKNHRKKMLEKNKGKNMLEVVKMAIINGWMQNHHPALEETKTSSSYI